jgi:hypothetical protein
MIKMMKMIILQRKIKLKLKVSQMKLMKLDNHMEVSKVILISLEKIKQKKILQVV